MTRHNKQGYTLIELLIFLALTSIFLVISTQLLQSAIDFKLESSSSTAVDLNGNFLYARLRYDIRRATSISSPATPNQVSDTLVLVIGGVNHTYSISSGRLVLSTPTLTAPLTDSSVVVQSFSVTRTGQSPQPSGVSIQFDLQSQGRTTGNITQRRSWQFSSVLR